tara:strand:- start:1699 stop:2613 length:915 start_codon:yes stop_codon:yes gene_type:complete
MEQDTSNPSDNLPADNKAANDQVFGSSSEFFEQLEQDVNGAVVEDTMNDLANETLDTGNDSPVQEATPEMDPQQSLQGNSNSNVNWEKRYKDSSREAQKLSARVKQLKPFEPLMDVMRKDKGLVTHIKDYLQNGGAPSKTVKEELGLDDDFHYDPNEAIENPESDSAKVFAAQMDRAVSAKVNTALDAEKKKSADAFKKQKLAQEANEFMKNNKLSADAMKLVLKKSHDSNLTFEDAYYLLNKGNANRNIANNAKQEVVQQMQNVRNIPQSASQTNSAQAEKSPTDNVFDTLLGQDDKVDNLFG